MDIFQDILGSAATSIAFVILLFAPIITIGFWLMRDRESQRRQLLEPFTDFPLRPAGESLRTKIEKLSEQFDDYLLVLTLVSAMTAGWLIGAQPNVTAKLLTGLLAANAAACLYAAPKMRAVAQQLRAHRLGYKGERLIGEMLNRLQADGFAIYHDLPFENYNIDHVIVGSCGVFVVETKTRSKRAGSRWEKRATATFDGRSIKFGDFVETDAVKQARMNAKDLGKWLTSATGESVRVEAIITSPGWYVPDALPIDGLAMWNPSRIRPFLLAKPKDVLSPEQRKRICHQLDQRCAWPSAKD